SLRSLPDASASIARVSRAFGTLLGPVEEVAQQLAPLLGQDRLRVKLNTLGGQLAVAHTHYHAPAGGRLLQALGQLRIDHQRVVAPDRQRAAQPAEDRAPVVLDRGGLTVDRRVQPDLPAERLRERLVAEAHPERGHTRLGHAPYE